MCNCQSNFFPYRKINTYSNFNKNQLRQQCADENNLDINDPKNNALLDACVQKKIQDKGNQVIGWVQAGGNFISQLGSVVQGLFNPQAPPQGYDMPLPQEEPKKIGTLGIILIIAGVGLVGFLGYKAFKNKGGK